jgi:hypothetical protein
MGTHGMGRGAKKKAFKKIKRTLTNAPALSWPDVMKSFFLYVHERLRTAMGVLIQLLRSWHCPVPIYQNNLCTFLWLAALPECPYGHCCHGG